MKKIKIYLVLLLANIIFPLVANAASGSVSISSSSTAVVGNKVTVTVTISSATKIGSWQMSLNYDKNFLQLTSSTARDGGTFMIDYAEDPGISKKSYTFTFKTLKSGTTKLSVDGCQAYASSDLSPLIISTNAKQIKIITQAELEASYSKNNNLSSLSLEGFPLTPDFKTDILEYNVVVPENTKEVNIKASAQDKKSSISGTGIQNVVLGSNQFQIVVRAQNGAEKKYIINVDVKDENPIEIVVGGKKYTVVKLKENLPKTNLYIEKTIKINGIDIPSFYNETAKLTLVGLKDEEGNISLFKYDNNKYEKYVEIISGNIQFTPSKITNSIPDYNIFKIKINDSSVEALKILKSSNYSILYGTNITDGTKGYYMYDEKNNSLVRFNDDLDNKLREEIKLKNTIILAISSVLGVLFILVVVLLISNAKKNKVMKKYLLDHDKKDDKKEIEKKEKIDPKKEK